MEFTAVQTHATDWAPDASSVTLFCELQARIVPSCNSPDGARLDAANLVVLDDFFGESELKDFTQVLCGTADCPSAGPSEDRWERNTADDAHGSKTWGLQANYLQQLAQNPTPGMIEIQSRLVRLYPDYIVAHMPSTLMHGFSKERAPGELHHHGSDDFPENASKNAENGGICQETILEGDSNKIAFGNSAEAREVGLRQNAEEPTHKDSSEDDAADCCSLLANAPVHGDHYNYHVDADPLTLPDCTWRRALGDYCNREPARPLLVSLLLYLVDDNWDPNWHAETLFLDPQTDIGIVIRPRKYRAVLMDQDVLHRVVQPSVLAKRPRYSLVWKLALLPKDSTKVCTIARRDWGNPILIGSAAHMDQVKRKMHQQLGKRRSTH